MSEPGSCPLGAAVDMLPPQPTGFAVAADLSSGRRSSVGFTGARGLSGGTPPLPQRPYSIGIGVTGCGGSRPVGGAGLPRAQVPAQVGRLPHGAQRARHQCLWRGRAPPGRTEVQQARSWVTAADIAQPGVVRAAPVLPEPVISGTGASSCPAPVWRRPAGDLGAGGPPIRHLSAVRVTGG